jgi:hypothetical protein
MQAFEYSTNAWVALSLVQALGLDLCCPELPVSRISQTRHNVARFV